MDNFIKLMPKIELHAHLNGSFTTTILNELAKDKFGEESLDYKNYKEKCYNLKNFSSKNLSECFEVFKTAHELITNLDLLKKATLLVIKEFYLDNTIYLELRTTPKKGTTFTKQEYLETIISSIKESQIVYPEIIVKLLPSFDRSRGISDAEDTLNIVEHLVTKYPNVIRGIDISGDPLAGVFTDYKPLLIKAKQLGLKLALHCAEVDNIESETKEMIDFEFERLGHGTFVKDKHLDSLKSKNICVECCLTSNIKCGTVRNYSDHHFKEMFFDHNVPVVICTDDCGVFNTNLSQELLIAVNSFGLNKVDALKLSQNAIEYSFANDSEKRNMKDKIQKYFESSKI